MTAISYHATINDLQGFAFAGRGPFGRPRWFALLEQGLPETGGKTPLFLLARNGTGALALPLVLQGNGLENLDNWYGFTWAPLATPGADGPALLGAAARDLAARTHRVTLGKLPEEDGTAALIAAAFRRAGWLVRDDICDTNRFLPVAGRSYGEYLATRPGALRTTLKRKSGRLEVMIYNDFRDYAWAEYEDVYRHSWKPGEGDRALLRRFAQGEGAAGRIRLALARHDGAVVAAQFWTVEDGVAWIHKLAHRESARALSPGTVLTAALMQRVIDQDRVELVDFGTGDDRYKRDWMECTRPRRRLACWRPGDPRNWPAIGKAALRTLVSRRAAG